MDIETFVINNHCKRKTVIKWIKEGFIPGGNLEKDYIPDSARVPYTGARAKNTDAIYFSMVKASRNRKHILPSLYHLCEEEFNAYVDRLVQAGLIEKRRTDGIVYYDATLKAIDANKQFILSALKAISQGVAEGVTTALL